MSSNPQHGLPQEKDFSKYETPWVAEKLEAQTNAVTKAAVRSAWATILTAIFTAVLTGVTVYQGYQLWKGQNDTRELLKTFKDQAEALKIAADEAKKQSQAAEKQANALLQQSKAALRQAEATQHAARTAEENAKATRNYFVREQRSWVAAANAELTEPTPTGSLVVVVANYGKLPATVTESRISVTNLPARTQFVPETPLYDTLDDQVVIFPGTNFTANYRLKRLPPNILDGVQDGRNILYVYLRLGYFDEYGAHSTHHCWYYNYSRKLLSFYKRCNTAD